MFSSEIIFVEEDEAGPRPLTADLEWSAQDLHRTVQQLAHHSQLLTQPQPIAPSVLTDIAHLGASLFEAIFPDEEMRDVIREACNDQTPPRFLIYTDNLVLPWSLLYVGKDLRRVEPTQFLGMRASMVRHLHSAANYPSQRGERRKETLTELHIKYGWDSYFPQILNVEAPYVFSLNGPNITVSGIKKLPSNDEPLKTCAAFLERANRDQPNMLHLSCHFEPAQTQDATRFRLRNGALISQQSLRLEKAKLQGMPIIFFNACEVGTYDPQSAQNFLDYCMFIGARAILAPETRVHDDGAAHFAVRFYEEFLGTNARLSEALLHTTVGLWEDEQRLCGLVYATYGNARMRYQGKTDDQTRQ